MRQAICVEHEERCELAVATYEVESTLLAYEEGQPGIVETKRPLDTWSKLGAGLTGNASGGFPCVEHGLVAVGGGRRRLAVLRVFAEAE